MNSQYNRIYNPASVETISGAIESVDKIREVR
jgi:hypothetical protein